MECKNFNVMWRFEDILPFNLDSAISVQSIIENYSNWKMKVHTECDSR